MKETLYVVINKKNLNINFKNKIDLFTLNEFVLTDIEKLKCKHFFPDPKKTSIESEELILKTHKIKTKIINKLEKMYIFQNIKDLDELVDPLLEIKLSRLFYLNKVLPDYKKYILVNADRNYDYFSKTDLILAIDKIYCDKKNKKNDFLKRFYKFKVNLYDLLLLKIQKILIKKIIKNDKRKILFFSDRSAYFIDNLKVKLRKKDDLVLYYLPTESYLRIFLLIVNQLFGFLFKNNLKEIGMFLLPYNKFEYSDLKLNENINEFYIQEIPLDYSKYLIKQLYSYVLNTASFTNYLINLFENSKIKNCFFHSVRFPDLFSFSRVLSKYNNDVKLISHGTHTIQKKDNLSFIASRSLAIGLTYTKEKRIKLLSQSSYCDDFLDMLEVKYLKINRIIKPINKDLSREKTSNNKSKFKILFVGTVKQLGERRYYFESSSEFFTSINNLYNKLNKYKSSLHIKIRIRDVQNEISNDILNNFIKNKKDFLTISNQKSIYNEIEKCDCLISFSSTTLEEGLFMNKPVMCYGLPKYNHLSQYESYEPENISKYNYDKLKIIESALERKFIHKRIKERKIDYFFT
jgi:hypothetical protein